jgi:pilus assembly protein Flp/PilA
MAWLASSRNGSLNALTTEQENYHMRKILSELYVKMQGVATTLIRDESGQDLIEYALVVALIALAATAGMTAVANNISNAFVHVGSHLASYTS